MDKLFYVLTRPNGVSLSDFSVMLRGDVGAAVLKELPKGTQIKLQIQDDRGKEFVAAQAERMHGGEDRLGSDAVSSPLLATVLYEGVERRVDAVVIVRIGEEGHGSTGCING